MCGDHGIGKCFDARLELPKAIAKHDVELTHRCMERMSISAWISSIWR